MHDLKKISEDEVELIKKNISKLKPEKCLNKFLIYIESKNIKDFKEAIIERDFALKLSDNQEQLYQRIIKKAISKMKIEDIYKLAIIKFQSGELEYAIQLEDLHSGIIRYDDFLCEYRDFLTNEEILELIKEFMLENLKLSLLSKQEEEKDMINKEIEKLEKQKEHINKKIDMKKKRMQKI